MDPHQVRELGSALESLADLMLKSAEIMDDRPLMAAFQIGATISTLRTFAKELQGVAENE